MGRIAKKNTELQRSAIIVASGVVSKTQTWGNENKINSFSKRSPLICAAEATHGTIIMAAPLELYIFLAFLPIVYTSGATLWAIKIYVPSELVLKFIYYYTLNSRISEL